MGHGTGQSQQTSTIVFNETNGLAELSSYSSLIFYIMMYHTVRNYKERFGIHVNIQTVVTFVDIGTCTTCLRMYPSRIIHTVRRYNDSSGSMILVHEIQKGLRRGGLTPACGFAHARIGEERYDRMISEAEAAHKRATVLPRGVLQQ